MGKMALQVIKCRPPWMLIMASSADQGPSFMQTRLLQRSHSSVAPRKNSVSTFIFYPLSSVRSHLSM